MGVLILALLILWIVFAVKKRKKNGLHSPARLRHSKPGQPGLICQILSARRHPNPEKTRFSLIRLTNRNLFNQIPVCRQPDKTGTGK